MIDRSQPRRGEEGFTLVELLVIVLIIGVLATLAIPSFFSVRDRAWHAAAKSDVRNMTKIHTTLESNGTYATTMAELYAAGLEATSDVQHGICADPDFGFAVAAIHTATDVVWVIDYQGRLTESAEATVGLALAGLAECGAGVNPVSTD